jgi:hypothetical protein
MGYKMRAVAVFDIDVRGIDDAASFEYYIKTKMKEIESPIQGVSIEQVISGIPFKERRGKSGSINEIVFRGTRGKYKKRGEKK